jgi:3-oxoacyl-[acyl-carrier protein] reductase
MNFNLDDKRVLITGASRGIGLAIADAFLREGARVLLIARTAADLVEATEKLSSMYGHDRVFSIPADCADESAWPNIAKHATHEWGGLDVVVANAGDGRSVPDAMPEYMHFNRLWRNNFTTAEVTARATLPLLTDSAGCLLFISSIAGLEAIGAPTDYSVAKSAIVALTKQLARKLAPRVRVNCLAPGNVMFQGGSWDVKIQADTEKVKALIEASVPMKRFGTPEEIADASVFLCSARASFITGACLVVDGGQTVSYF